MSEEIDPVLLEAVKRESKEGKMECARAQALAAELGVPMIAVGRALDTEGIKIVACQLGCF